MVIFALNVTFWWKIEHCVRVGFAQSKWPHLHRAYLLASRLNCTPLYLHFATLLLEYEVDAITTVVKFDIFVDLVRTFGYGYPKWVDATTTHPVDSITAKFNLITAHNVSNLLQEGVDLVTGTQKSDFVIFSLLTFPAGSRSQFCTSPPSPLRLYTTNKIYLSF